MKKSNVEIIIQKEPRKSLGSEWQALLGLPFAFMGLSVTIGLLVILSMLNDNNIYLKNIVIIFIIELVVGLYFIYNSVKHGYYTGKYWKEQFAWLKIEFLKYKSKSWKMDIAVNIIIILTVALSPFIFGGSIFDNSSDVNLILSLIASFNIAFICIWLTFFYGPRRIILT